LPITNEPFDQILDLLKIIVREKLKNYGPETDHMPFPFRLLGRDICLAIY